ncbi:hypothetical protein Q0812_00845 [Brevundimonas sp. 2R-24]|uniref:Terminase small subunit n=1 Tax=Peiella sedimenti TaxID=3061083 RepID=A0ABT8SHC5_9CAUL|nr:hypothetical protein [Caulobacteraceae bacterium XZ-24]
MSDTDADADPGPEPDDHETRPAHYHLSRATWKMILDEYKAGATAPFLAAKWRVSVQAIRARITRHKATKRDWGDAQALAQAQARDEALRVKAERSPKARAARLFEGLVDEAAGPGDEATPAALMRQAVIASGRAMHGRLWNEARVLSGLAEAYGRLARAQRDAGLGPDWGPPMDARREDEMREELLRRLARRAKELRAERRAQGLPPYDPDEDEDEEDWEQSEEAERDDDGVEWL